MIIKRIVVGPIEANCYLVADNNTKESVIIDPGDEADKIFDAIEKNNLKPKFILLTHEHPDHIGAVSALEKKLETPTFAKGEVGAPTLKGVGVEVLATPGHTPESVCYIVGENIFSGDTLFKGGIGRTDLEGGDFGQIQKSLKRLMQFPDHFKVFPGHGPETTIGKERQDNPFLL